MTPVLKAACARAVHVITADGRILRAGLASVFILRELGWKSARGLGWPPLIWLVEIGYWLVARNRTLASRFLFRP